MCLDTGEESWDRSHPMALTVGRMVMWWPTCERAGHLYFFCTMTYEGMWYLWKKCSRCGHVWDAQPLIDE